MIAPVISLEPRTNAGTPQAASRESMFKKSNVFDSISARLGYRRDDEQADRQ
jgi:hypothetical protein